MDSTAWIVLHR